ncbi:Fc.00g030690.m01.CDS01 [Cosmosporella sp. VM-42]
MNTSEKRRPAAGPGLRASNRNSMPAPPPRAAMASSSSPEEPHEGGVSLTDRREREKDKDVATARSASVKDKDKDREKEKEKKERKEKREKREKEREREGLLKEKDEKIGYLEREMEIMEREFHKELDKLSQNESETATFWQAKHSALNQQFLRTDTELRLLRAEVDVRDAEREELREGWEVLRRELKERDDEIRGLRGQVRGLKEWVSTSTRTDGQTSDEVFGDDLEDLDEATLAELNELVPMYEDLAQTAKVHLLQSIVSRILVEMVFDAYFVGLSDEQTQQFRQMERMLSEFASSDEPINQWRSSTLTLLRREAPSHLTLQTTHHTERVITRINTLLTPLTRIPPTPARDTALRVLINNSIELARLLVVQKAVLSVYMPPILPHQQVLFEAETMEDLGGEDEDMLDGREICCVAFPGVIKRGDENGGHLQYRNVIAKARVLCSPE